MGRLLSAFALAIVTMTAFTTGAHAAGPGGWAHAGHGATATTSALNGAVQALAQGAPGVTFAGGSFTDAGGVAAADRIAAWNGTTWNALGASSITNGAVYAIAYSGGRVFAGGSFVNAGGNPNADFLAVWDGVTWAPFCNSIGAAFNGNVKALQIIGSTLYVGGEFQNGAAIPSADYLLACDLTTGGARSTVTDPANPFSGPVYALTADSAGRLYAGGNFSNLEAIDAADHIAYLDGSGWHAMGSGPGPGSAAVTGIVRALAAQGTNVYVGTDSKDVAGIARADNVAGWNGTAWFALGSNTGNTNGWFTTLTSIRSLTTYGALIIAGGSFQNANAQATADDIAFFDGAAWRPLGSNGLGDGPLNRDAEALTVVGPRVFAGGGFSNAGGDALADGIASYLLRQPDAQIASAAAGPFVGNNVYSATGAGQTKAISVRRTHSATVYVRIQNDSLVKDAFRLRGTGGARGFTAHYFTGSTGGTDVTAAVRAGTFTTPLLAPGRVFTLRAVLRVASTSAASASFVLAATSVGGGPPDAVRVTVRAT